MITRSLLSLIVAIILLGCSSKQESDVVEIIEETKPEYYSANEQFRPRYHFTSLKNWINDPNGLVFHEGKYHLFYQYNPFGIKWGHMSWGHAISEDLLTWKHLPVALYEEDSVAIFSGSAIIDKMNSKGICPEPDLDCMLAYYTSNKDQVFQNQSMAFSQDGGESWTKYVENPILDIDRKDFRDPKVFWHEETGKWIMAVMIPDVHKVQFYSSTDLVDWMYMSDFGQVGDVSRVWECPDLFELPVQGTDKKKWVLVVSSGHYQGDKFVGMQYFIGEFDGDKFVADEDEYPLWLDYGKDYYAAVTYNDTDDRILVGWVNNWTYANDIPTNPWRGMMALPRKLSLKEINGKVRLIQTPVKPVEGKEYEFDDLKVDQSGVEETLDHSESMTVAGFKSQSFILHFKTSLTESQELNIELLKNREEATLITVGNGKLKFDRRNSGQVDFQEDFASIEEVNISTAEFELEFIVDQSIVEVIINQGEATLTNQVFPSKGSDKIRITTDTGSTVLKQLEILDLEDFKVFYR